MELVFEIGCEDLPARFVEPTLRQLHDHFVAECAARRIAVEGARTVGTPRRLALLCDALPQAADDLSEERTGPPAAVAFKDGAPTKAAEGFARGQGASVEDLYTVATDKGEYIAVKVFEKGAATRDVLPEILAAVLGAFTFPKSMRWAAYGVPFGRPVRWLVALLDGEVVPLEFAGVTSSNTTRGHRFAPAPGHDSAPSMLTVSGVDGYLSALKGNGIIVDVAARRDEVARLVLETATEADGTAVNDPGLVDEVTNLVESPHAVLVRYDASYLELPDEVLVSSMRGHQRYFAVQGEDGNLTNACVVVYNTPVRDPAVVASGNLRVLKARLDDAKFFWSQDLKKPLADYVDDLANVLWLKQLGSLQAKSQRIGELAGRIAASVGQGDETIAVAQRAGLLCKADLVTQMVYEFPDLQGTMGREYALRADEGEAVATAIFEQYLPRGADDVLPQSNAGACVSLAEKLDSLVGCFLIDLVPSSTADPYGLRRAALGTIRVLQERGWTVSLAVLVDQAAAVYAATIDAEWTAQRRTSLLDFIAARLEHQLAGDFPTDIVRAVLAVGLEDVTSVTDRVKALSDLREDPVFEPLAAGFKRVVNILRKQASEFEAETLLVDPELFEHPQEHELWAASTGATAHIATAVEARDWDAAVRVLAGLRAPVDEFFDHVMVMADDQRLKRNRLALLFEVETLFKRVADLSVVS